MWIYTITILLFILLASAVYLLISYVSEERSGSLNLKLFINQTIIEGKIAMVSLKSTQYVEGQLVPVDRLGNPANVEPGSVSFSSTDENVFTVEQDTENELLMKVVARGVGVAQFDYSADADLGEGVTTITGFTGVEVLPAEAVGFGITFGEPQEQQ